MSNHGTEYTVLVERYEHGRDGVVLSTTLMSAGFRNYAGLDADESHARVMAVSCWRTVINLLMDDDVHIHADELPGWFPDIFYADYSVFDEDENVSYEVSVFRTRQEE